MSYAQAACTKFHAKTVQNTNKGTGFAESGFAAWLK